MGPHKVPLGTTPRVIRWAELCGRRLRKRRRPNQLLRKQARRTQAWKRFCENVSRSLPLSQSPLCHCQLRIERNRVPSHAGPRRTRLSHVVNTNGRIDNRSEHRPRLRSTGHPRTRSQRLAHGFPPTPPQMKRGANRDIRTHRTPMASWQQETRTSNHPCQKLRREHGDEPRACRTTIET